MADKRAQHLRQFVAPFQVPPGKKVRLARDFDPGYTADFVHRDDAIEFLQHGVQLLAEYQERLAAQDKWGVLVCLQALDAAGKDGTIRHVMSGVNPQGVHVQSFKVPSAEEIDHNYLWRYSLDLPARGEIGIYNRSHYEEVLVVRVHPELLERQRLPKQARGNGVWRRRYRDINAWEQHLTDNGFRIVKLFLNVSKEEQRERFLKRIDDPNKNWKFSDGDAREREHWDAYQKALSEMLSATSTEWAPWYVIPGDHKWFARMCVSAILALTLIDIDPRFPVVDDAKRQELAQARLRLMAEGLGGKPGQEAASAAERLAATVAASASAKKVDADTVGAWTAKSGATGAGEDELAACGEGAGRDDSPPACEVHMDAIVRTEKRRKAREKAEKKSKKALRKAAKKARKAEKEIREVEAEAAKSEG
ncbi:MAG: polyphosphate kinase 2 family protein [Thermoleophilia bacterium]